jgi:hypothetical protein
MCVQLIKSMCGMSYRPIIIKIRHKRDYPWNVYIPVGFGISVVELMTPICCPVNLFFLCPLEKLLGRITWLVSCEFDGRVSNLIWNNNQMFETIRREMIIALRKKIRGPVWCKYRTQGGYIESERKSSALGRVLFITQSSSKRDSRPLHSFYFILFFLCIACETAVFSMEKRTKIV